MPSGGKTRTKSERLRDLVVLIEIIRVSAEDEAVSAVETPNDANFLVLRAALFRAHARLLEAREAVKEAADFAYVLEKPKTKDKEE